MHRDVVPTQAQLTRAERPIAFLPPPEEIVEGGCESAVQRGEAATQQCGDIDALGVVVQLAAVDGQSRCAREWPWKALGIEQIPHVVAHAALDRFGAPAVAGEA